MDVNRDGGVTPLDALVLIIALDGTPGSGASWPAWYDVSQDGVLSPLDVLLVINWLNSRTLGSEAPAIGSVPASAFAATAPEGEAMPAPTRVTRAASVVPATADVLFEPLPDVPTPAAGTVADFARAADKFYHDLGDELDNLTDAILFTGDTPLRI